MLEVFFFFFKHNKVIILGQMTHSSHSPYNKTYIPHPSMMPIFWKITRYCKIAAVSERIIWPVHSLRLYFSIVGATTMHIAEPVSDFEIIVQ